MDYFIDKRIFVTGKKSVMYMDNPFNLTQYMIGLIDTYGITSARNGLHLATVLNNAGQMTNEVRMGGDLIEDTVISGLNYSWEVTGCNTITLDSTVGLDVLSSAMTLSADTILYIQTPNVLGTIATNNQVLTLIDSLTGEVEFADAAGGAVQGAINGVNITAGNVELGGDLIKNTTVHGQGTWDMNFLEIFKYRLTIDEEMYLTIGGSEIIAGIGGVLTLLDPITGECRWSAPPALPTDISIYTDDGSLDANRTLDGASSFNLTFIELGDFTVETINNMSFIEGNSFLIDDYSTFIIQNTATVTLAPQSELRLDTPGAGAANVGDVLTLVTPATGECEWAAPSGGGGIPSRYVQTFADTDWVIPSSLVPGPGNFDLTIPAATHGKGLNPIVQVQLSGLALGPVEGIVNLDQTGGGPWTTFAAITIVVGTGDVILTNFGGYGPPFGRVIIM